MPANDPAAALRPIEHDRSGLRPLGAAAPRRRRWPALLASAGLVGGCQAQPGAVGGPAAEARLLARIEAEVGNAACEHDAQCHTLALGAKACGGPARWLAWSSANGRQDLLLAWSDELAALQSQRWAASGIKSTCSTVPDPGAVCSAGRCSLAGR